MVNGIECYVYFYQQEIDVLLELFFYKLQFMEWIYCDFMNWKIVEVEFMIIQLLWEYVCCFNGLFCNVIFEMCQKWFVMILNFNILLEKDIVLYLQLLLDGEYVQYYCDFFYIDGKMVCFRNNIVCVIFWLKNNLLEGFVVWFIVDGDIIKYGNFIVGEKIGLWEYCCYFFWFFQIKFEFLKFLDNMYW